MVEALREAVNWLEHAKQAQELALQLLRLEFIELARCVESRKDVEES
jgi:hypothetical protein